VGWSYAKGAGVEQDRTKAFAHNNQGADKGNVWALAKLACYCLLGKDGIGGMVRGTKILLALGFVIVRLVAENR
jgi:TPR repeat protein